MLLLLFAVAAATVYAAFTAGSVILPTDPETVPGIVALDAALCRRDVQTCGDPKRRFFMQKFVPLSKCSKKERRRRNAQARTVWQICPATRCPKRSGVYDRNKFRRQTEAERRAGSCSDQKPFRKECIT